MEKKVSSIPPFIMEVIKSQKGKDLLSYDGYLYRKNKTNKTSQNWRCVMKDCRGTLKTVPNYQEKCEAKIGQEHNHGPDHARQSVRIALGKMNEQASNCSAPPRRVIAAVVQELDDEAMANVPKKRALQKRIQRRRKVEGHFPEPLSINELIIPEEFKTFTINGNTEPFLLSDVASDSKRIIIFASQHMLDQLANSKIWMCDGTFKIVPRIFYQSYTIHVVRENFLFPCVYVMMPDKAQSTYERVFQILKDKRPDCDPENVTLDFENSAINASMTVYPDANINECFFHLSQSIWRKIQITGLSNSYISDVNCRLDCKMLAALAFLNPDEVTDAFEELNEDLERLQLDEEMQILYDYFEDIHR
ncbi:uncharacterized protein LOC135213860 [Macrobrachium nipponense]|uniref:uncharacterized protein LOC135213860 n=1 Tax=Macrobrachium nipponense TaxID=159736 RepID=UPI0030C7F3EE